jgi:hypothetical protein
MIINSADLKQDALGRAILTMTVNASPAEVAERIREIRQGKKYSVGIHPYREPKSHDQLGAIWGKIGEIADALYASKEEIYEECLRRYGQGTAMRIKTDALPDVERVYRLVDVKQERGDGTVFVKAYKGLSQMDTAEASRLLEGVLDECKSMGISTEIRND